VAHHPRRAAAACLRHDYHPSRARSHPRRRPTRQRAPRPRGRWLFIDWDRASHGPRELDLTFAIPTHFRKPDNDRAEFSAAYGYDITVWASWSLIRDLSELHSLAGYIRRAPTNPAAHDELHRRVDSLLTDDRSVSWRSVTD